MATKTENDIKILEIPEPGTGQDTAGEGSFSNRVKQALAMRVSSVLQTTLDVEQLVTLFAQQVKPAIPFEQLCYTNSQHQLSFCQGREAEHNMRYRLIVHGESLGEISLSRKWPLNAQEAKVFEYVTSSLIYPLRNSLLYRQALQAAHKDALTGVYNRATFEESLAREVSLAQRYKRPLALLVLDVDHFKTINDTLGHAAGDCAIKSVAELTTDCIRSTDILFRYGGEEFVVLLNNTDLDGAKNLAERIRKSVEDSVTCCPEQQSIRMTISLGVAEFQGNETPAHFFSRADQALYAAKDSGRNRVETAPLEHA